eukprot:TRINITY_DN9991_c0_g1_i1.p1 TRINITY_DN9991_c0_g1~~TRINITY_DN9991_c0_g1_i1.p1  ORF type:complete len:919 (+),score=185.41 TRINITY_DN9991_c0_g1_i1:146-2902(+)
MLVACCSRWLLLIWLFGDAQAARDAVLDGVLGPSSHGHQPLDERYAAESSNREAVFEASRPGAGFGLVNTSASAAQRAVHPKRILPNVSADVSDVTQLFPLLGSRADGLHPELPVGLPLNVTYRNDSEPNSSVLDSFAKLLKAYIFPPTRRAAGHKARASSDVAIVEEPSASNETRSRAVEYLMKALWYMGYVAGESAGNGSATPATSEREDGLASIAVQSSSKSAFQKKLPPDNDLAAISSPAAGRHLSGLPSLVPETWPSGVDIWRQNISWTPIRRLHASGVLSNLNGGKLLWTEAPYISYGWLLTLTLVAYPVLQVAFIMLCTVLVALCLVERDLPEQDPDLDECDEGNPEVTSRREGDSLRRNGGEMEHQAILSPMQLTAGSRWLYAHWELCCRMLPALLVFGSPTALLLLSIPYPQEVLLALLFLTTGLVFANGVHICVYGTSGVIRLMAWSKTDFARKCKDVLASRRRAGHGDIIHWVIVPQYQEEVEVVASTLKSISQSTLAKDSIGIMLAMEERESAARCKAVALQKLFGLQFKEMRACFHPLGLPRDPPGKASNVAWAFRELRKLVEEERACDLSQVVLTVADADSDFHPRYFEALTYAYLKLDERSRASTIWQAPVFHLRNYHRQPFPIVPGSAVTCITELATLCDPHAFHCPYSTYSLPMVLAKQVGGWDSEWIAEDWHMGIKCFLSTYGGSCVKPLWLPIINYTPEDSCWTSTLQARWTQAKRHALGFSDLAYVFMTLPLLAGRKADSAGAAGGCFWRVLLASVSPVLRLVNCHVILGVLTTYTAFMNLLQLLLKAAVSEDRRMPLLFDCVSDWLTPLFVSTLLCKIILTTLFVAAYGLVQNRLEGEPFRYQLVHWLYAGISLVVFMPLYFLMLGVAAWKAAISIMSQRSFEYEVALKPTQANHLK